MKTKTGKNDSTDIPGMDIAWSRYENPWRIVGVYLVAGILWILFSDHLINLLAVDHAVYMRFQSAKGGIFVALTAFLLYIQVKKDYARIAGLSRTVFSVNRELTAYAEDIRSKDLELQKKNASLNQTLDALTAQNQFIQEVYRNSNTIIMIWNETGAIRDVNDAFQPLFGYPRDEILGAKWADLLLADDEKETLAERLRRLQAEGVGGHLENRMRHKSGEVLHILWNETFMRQSLWGEPVIVSFGIDLTSEKAKEKQIRNLAYRDPLTGLQNRIVFEDQIQTMLDTATPFAVYALDIDNFRTVNDLFGHRTGDLFLNEMARRLTAHFIFSALYTWGGDTFFLLDPHIGKADLDRTVATVFDALESTWEIGDLAYKPSLCIGIAVYPRDGSTLDELLQSLDIALNKAKSRGKGSVSRFEQTLLQEVFSRNQLERSIEDALEKDGFLLHYQPIYAMPDKKLHGFEALLRWSLQGIPFQTGELISFAEETQHIIDIDFWVIRHAFGFLQRLPAGSPLLLSINLSAKTVVSGRLLPFLETCLAAMPVKPGSVQFEITEHSLIYDSQISRATMKGLKELGFLIALDDFGTQYSSLNYLVDMPFDTLKIDKSYVDKVLDHKRGEIIVAMIINLGKQLDIATVAEGIEQPDQWDKLLELGCDLGQGYLLDRPMPEEEALSLLVNRTAPETKPGG
jgi:diguanylate cyclase (GGDEF)-like protein/PAS domain S-box-containing protein